MAAARADPPGAPSAAQRRQEFLQDVCWFVAPKDQQAGTENKTQTAAL